jgi:hypothetical protein
MWTKRINDIIAMLLIGDGALTLIGARNRALVWCFGPERLRKSTSWQADHPLDPRYWWRSAGWAERQGPREGLFCELRHNGVLRSSAQRHRVP